MWTLTSEIEPLIPDTTHVAGYGVAGAASLIVIAPPEQLPPPPPPVVPSRRKTWSGPVSPTTQVVRRPHVGQMPKPPPGFSQAAPLFEPTARLSQYHWPFVLKSMFA